MNRKTTPGHACPTCSSTVIGRADKIYCSISCKNAHHAATRRSLKPVVSEIDRRLKRNYVVLQGLMGRRQTTLKTTLNELSMRGFDPAHSTSAYIDEDGRLILHCYRFRYFVRKDGIVFIYRNVEETDVLPGVFERWGVEFPEGYVLKMRRDEEPNWARLVDFPKRE